MIEGRVRQLRVPLSGADYDLAIEAHRISVQCSSPPISSGLLDNMLRRMFGISAWATERGRGSHPRRRARTELNPDELLNQDVKTNAVGRKPPIDADDLMANVRGFMRSKQRTPDAVRSYFRGRHVSYAAL